MRSLAAYITLLSVLTASSAVPTSRYERLELARSGTGAASNRPRLPAEVHRQLLLNGRPQIGLHKALTEQLVAQQAQGHIRSGIQRRVISRPTPSSPVPTWVFTADASATILPSKPLLHRSTTVPHTTRRTALSSRCRTSTRPSMGHSANVSGMMTGITRRVDRCICWMAARPVVQTGMSCGDILVSAR